MRILLVEDDKFFRQFYALKLKEKNVIVDEAGDGDEGLQKVQENIPDIVLLDLIMPNKDGFEFLSGLGELNLLSKIPVLVFSTLAQEKDIQKAKDLGASGYVNKSFFDFDRLFATIMQLCTVPVAQSQVTTTVNSELNPAPVQGPPVAPAPVQNPPPDQNLSPLQNPSQPQNAAPSVQNTTEETNSNK